MFYECDHSTRQGLMYEYEIVQPIQQSWEQYLQEMQVRTERIRDKRSKDFAKKEWFRRSQVYHQMIEQQQKSKRGKK